MQEHFFRLLMSALEKKYGKISQQKIARQLGVSQPTVGNWLNGVCPPKESNIEKLVGLFVDHHTSSLIRPVFEFTEISPVKSGNSWRLHQDKEVEDGLKKDIDKKKGIYVFYDSAGKATYLGLSESNLWSEIKQRLKAETNRPFYKPQKRKPLSQGEIACFMSVYEVTTPAAIKNIESFMLRAFANDLMNKNGGEFKEIDW